MVLKAVAIEHHFLDPRFQGSFGDQLADTAEAVTRVLAEKTAGRDDGGSIDLIWINGENFASMKEQDLLFGPFVSDLPNLTLALYSFLLAFIIVPVSQFQEKTNPL